MRKRPWPSSRRRELTSQDSDGSILVRDANIWNGGGFTRGSILIEDGKISRIARRIDKQVSEKLDASGLHALPGLVDVHVHLRDMKLAYKEDFATGTAAAAAGGFTTVLDMPNTIPPTDSPQRLVEKQVVAAKKAHVNIGFHAAAVSDEETVGDLARAGAFSLKLYMPKPIAPFDVGNNDKVRSLMKEARDAGIPVTVHAEGLRLPENTTVPKNFMELAEARSPDTEERAVDRILNIQRGSGCQVHLCHLTLRSSLEKVASRSAKLSSEVTPHHLLLSRRVLRELKWKAWMVPPLRSERDRRDLLAAASSGLSDVIASDHAPHAIEEKDRPPGTSLPGVPGLETTLPLMLTLVSRGVLTLAVLVKLLSENPARIFGLSFKARLRTGADGDLVLIDLKKKSRIDSSKFFSKAKFSPFDGYQTRGGVDSTLVGGRLVYHDGGIVAREGCGSVLRSSLLN